MKILILGGTRFFGKRFVQLMLDHGHSVTLLTRGQSADSFGNRVSRLVADRTDVQQLKNVVRFDYDVVVDNVLTNAQEAKDAINIFQDRIGHYIMTSTMSVYDPQSEALLESDFEAASYVPQTPSNSGEAYQQGKRAAEHALLQAPFSVSRMRIPLIVGPDDYTHRLLAHVTAVKEGKALYFPNSNAKFTYLHAQDAARALAWLCTDKPAGVFNVSAPDAWEMRELMLQIGQVVGKEFVFGDEKDEPSPFSYSQNFFMNVDKAERAGFQVAKLEDWMPELISDLSLRT